MSETASADLEREAEEVRARISETADQLRARMTPGQMMDQLLNQFRAGDAGEMLGNLRGQARDNPMALALIGSGVAWLMFGSGAQSGGAREMQSGGAGETYGQPSRFAAAPPEPPRAYGTGSPEFDAGSDEGASLADRASETFASVREGVGDRLHGASEGLADMAGGMRSAGADALGQAGDKAAQLGQQARSTLLDVLDREPLVLGALGVAVGAAIGAMLPVSEIERQHLGATGKALKDEAEALASRGMATAKEAAGEVYRTARDEADRQGLLPADASVGSKVEAVVRAAAGAVETRAADLVSEAETDGRPAGGTPEDTRPAGS